MGRSSDDSEPRLPESHPRIEQAPSRVEPLTLFSWGYYGWGNSLPQLDLATTAVEAARGFEPPVFVDVRFSRSVRAGGFRDHAFERSLPAGRYAWMKGLGNAAIGSGGLQIHQPETAEQLLDLAIKAAGARRRVIFFCSCDTPEHCHRNQVRDLVLAAARRRRMHLRVVEWPGGTPVRAHAFTMEVPAGVFGKLLGDAPRVPIDEERAIAMGAVLPHGSFIEITCGPRRATISVGPARFSAGKWFLPVFVRAVEEGQTIEDVVDDAEKKRLDQNYVAFDT